MLDRIPAPALAADILLVFHALVVVFVVFGQALILAGGMRGWGWVRNFCFRIVHLVTIGYVVVQTWFGEICPLTVWEQQLRRRAGQTSHDQAFVEYWLSQLLFFDLPWWVFVVVYTAFGAVVVASWWWVPPRWPETVTSGRGSR